MPWIEPQASLWLAEYAAMPSGLTLEPVPEDGRSHEATSPLWQGYQAGRAGWSLKRAPASQPQGIMESWGAGRGVP